VRYVCLCALLVIASSGCTEETEEIPCAELLNGVCVGVENEAGDKAGACPCTGPMAEVHNQAELAAALAGAPSCVTLADGKYGVVEVHDGFQLVGASAKGVVLDWLSFVDGAASACRLTTTGATVWEGASGTMQYLSVGPSPDDGVIVGAGAEARIVGSTIARSKRYGVSAFGHRSLTIERTLFDGSSYYATGPGIWASCPEGCACAAIPELVVRDSIVREAGIVGLLISGTHAELNNLRIERTSVGPNLEAGIGLAVTQCATVTGTQLQVVDNEDPGMCLDGSKVTLDDVEVSGNLRGIMLVSHSAPSEVHLTGATVTNNQGVGIGIAGAIFAVVDDSIVDNTMAIALPALIDGTSAGAVSVGDGVCWNGSAVAHIHRMTVKGSQRNGFLINGPASGILEDVTLADGQIVQINYETGSQPMTSGATPPIEPIPEDMFCIEDRYPAPAPM